MRVVVCTIVHHPADARIYHRQIRALLDAGHEVTYIAPVGPQDFHPERAGSSLQLRPVPRAAGRRRTGAILAARSALARHASGADLLLIHDPELLLDGHRQLQRVQRVQPHASRTELRRPFPDLVGLDLQDTVLDNQFLQFIQRNISHVSYPVPVI